MDEACYTFDAIRGIQAGKSYYLVMCPIKLISKIFLFDEDELPAELRAQRVINRSRIPEITRYILNNPTEYAFSALTASIDGKVEFKPVAETGAYRNIGKLEIAMTSRLMINDGQHRRAAIEEALKERRDFGEETISVVFFIDEGLKRSQQLFVDLNKHAVKPSNSLTVLFEHREPLADLAKHLAMNVVGFKGLIEMEKTSISNRSIKLFTLSGLYQATRALLQNPAKSDITPQQQRLAVDFWNTLSEIFPEWKLASERKASSYDLRKECVHAHGVVLHALGIMGASLIATYPNDWKERLHALKKINWSRTNTGFWEGRAMLAGRMSKAHNNVILTASYLKKVLDLPLTEEEARIEESYLRALGED
ncbi:MAG: DNA sulfur modification protein DndB [Chloroflexi bacterium]|uniref:DNA sulfur modification protein DndB n=1 Tax=Candidatus Chlorohelix allophototropha TaxID=3003348 RepID=A0A8T7M4E7_9CHLR|nr:DNA sulfur modification protein DndB [Chloroflexota bacterium]WJW70071.1 DNA sulfur modification protein DndB [Chloroflexota bacterium L227-S17]